MEGVKWQVHLFASPTSWLVENALGYYIRHLYIFLVLEGGIEDLFKVGASRFLLANLEIIGGGLCLALLLNRQRTFCT